MAFFYVEDGGIGGGSYGSAQASWPANYYDSIVDAVDIGGAGSGDIICLSDEHNQESQVEIIINGPTTGDGLTITTVDRDNPDQEVSAYPATRQEYPTSDSITFFGRIRLKHVFLETNNNFVFKQDSSVVLEECKLKAIGNNDIAIQPSGDGVTVTLINSDLEVSGTAVPISANSAAHITMYGGSIVGSDATEEITKAGFGNGGAIINLFGVDLTGVCNGATDNYLIRDTGSDLLIDDMIIVNIQDCEIGSGLDGFHNETFVNYNMRLRVSGTADTDAEAEYQFYEHSLMGTVETLADNASPTVYRNDSIAWSSGRKTVYKIDTTAEADIATGFFFDMGSVVANFSEAATDTLSFFFASETTINTKDIWITVTGKDGTNLRKGKTILQRGDIIAADSECTDDSSNSDWQDASGELSGWNEYRIDVSLVDFADGVVDVVFGVAKECILYLDTTIEVGAG